MSAVKYSTLAFLALLLTGCGQTGALYLPDEPQQVIVRDREAATSPAPSDSPTSSDPPVLSDVPTPPPPLT